jgi:hypothetical protein
VVVCGGFLLLAPLKRGLCRYACTRSCVARSCAPGMLLCDVAAAVLVFASVFELSLCCWLGAVRCSLLSAHYISTPLAVCRIHSHTFRASHSLTGGVVKQQFSSMALRFSVFLHSTDAQSDTGSGTCSYVTKSRHGRKTKPLA